MHCGSPPLRFFPSLSTSSHVTRHTTSDPPASSSSRTSFLRALPRNHQLLPPLDILTALCFFGPSLPPSVSSCSSSPTSTPTCPRSYTTLISLNTPKPRPCASDFQATCGEAYLCSSLVHHPPPPAAFPPPRPPQVHASNSYPGHQIVDGRLLLLLPIVLVGKHILETLFSLAHGELLMHCVTMCCCCCRRRHCCFCFLAFHAATDSYLATTCIHRCRCFFCRAMLPPLLTTSCYHLLSPPPFAVTCAGPCLSTLLGLSRSFHAVPTLHHHQPRRSILPASSICFLLLLRQHHHHLIHPTTVAVLALTFASPAAPTTCPAKQ